MSPNDDKADLSSSDDFLGDVVERRLPGPVETRARPSFHSFSTRRPQRI